MLFPHSHAWTPLQKWLIVGAGVIALICLGMLVHVYERYYRGPSESAFFGIWETDGWYSDDPCIYVELKRDHSLSISLSPAMDEERGLFTGRWYAGGPNMYVYFPPYSSSEPSHRPWVLPILDIQAEQFQVRFTTPYGGDAQVLTFRRAHLNSPSASNHAMERTPTRHAFAFFIAPTLSLRATLALGGRRSSYSR